MALEADMSPELIDAVAAISSASRLEYAAAGPPTVGFVALATLRHLVRRGPRSVTDLARTDRVTTQAISLRIRPLVEEGLVTRGPDPTDGRRTVVAATGAGRAAIAASERRSADALSRAVAALDRDEVEALRTAVPALRRVAALMHEAAR